jgi:hypothetical protein
MSYSEETLEKARRDIVDYLWELRKQEKGCLHQRNLAAAIGVAPKLVGEAMTGDRIHAICGLSHSGYRVLVEPRRGVGHVYKVTQEHDPATLSAIRTRWRSVISKKQREIAELSVKYADLPTQQAMQRLANLLEGEELALNDWEMACSGG